MGGQPLVWLVKLSRRGFLMEDTITDTVGLSVCTCQREMLFHRGSVFCARQQSFYVVAM